MTKPFTYLHGASLDDILATILKADTGSIPVDYELFRDEQRAWLLRELETDHHFRFIECFEFRLSDSNEWGLRGWGEDEGIPYADCPLHLLSQANGAINYPWRRKVYEFQSQHSAIPRGAWLHSASGITLPDGRTETDFQYLGDKTYLCSAGKAWTLPQKVIRRLLTDGGGVAFGRA